MSLSIRSVNILSERMGTSNEVAEEKEEDKWFLGVKAQECDLTLSTVIKRCRHQTKNTVKFKVELYILSAYWMLNSKDV